MNFTIFTDECVTEKISTPPGYRLDVDSIANCNHGCSVKNISYILYLNYHISLLIENSFPVFQQPFYHVKLYPIHPQTGDCVDNKINKTYECVCKPKYIIMISKFLNEKIQRLITESAKSNTKEITIEENFSAFIVMLKFYPVTAPLFLGFLLNKLNVSLTKFDIQPFEISDEDLDIEAQIINNDTKGVNEYRDTFIEKERELFQIIMKVISAGQCNLRTLAKRYLDDRLIYLWSLSGFLGSGGLGIAFLLRHLFY